MSSPHLKLDAKQSQNLVLTPQMQQAIKLLQFNAMDLEEYLTGMLETNPFLEHDRGLNEDGIDGSDYDNDDYQGDAYDAAQTEGSLENDLDVSYDNQFDDDYLPATQSSNYDEDYNYLDDTASAAPCLREHIEQQMRIAFTDNKYLMIGKFLFDNIDARGWLVKPHDELQKEGKIDSEDFNIVLEKMKTFDPVGIFAGNLGECLALQLLEKNRLDPAMQIFLDNIEMIAAREYKKLMRICNVDEEDLRDMLADIKSLNPSPISQFKTYNIETLVPDVYVRKGARNNWVIELGKKSQIPIRTSEQYYQSISKQTQKGEEKQYIQQNWQEAKWVVRALSQRNDTIVRVSQAITRRQIDFFRKGINGLKPLILKDIAQDVSMHESTISRTCSGKYMATPHGVFEMKYFFTNALKSGNGDDTGLSSEAVRKRIKNLIAAEMEDKILSDDAIVEILRKEQIDIARRTVAKYRDLMKIPSSAQRKRDRLAIF